MLVLKRIKTIPAWALLSLVMNGLLFLTVLLVMQETSQVSEERSSVLPQANASVLEPMLAADSRIIPQLGKHHRLNYQQWISLLRREAKALAARNPKHVTILLGDSITLWFPQELLPGRKTWLNQGISGQSSGGLLERLDLMDSLQPEAIYIMVGINDLVWGKQDAYLLNSYEGIILYLKQAHPQAKVVVQSILPHGAENSTWVGRDRLLVLPNSRIRAVNQELKAIADAYNVYFLDLYPLFANGDGNLRADLTTDGIHLNRAGYLVWRTAIALFDQVELFPE
ncbi:MAG: GDSL-type esterase/lipase family protein [Leptolyngbyaceae cyanobacterium MO_188.B28]|nr:GDSL-type esterase/lipase family protein [Leptolyngbyaceae cyanobacterium MO_188.B28]